MRAETTRKEVPRVERFGGGVLPPGLRLRLHLRRVGERLARQLDRLAAWTRQQGARLAPVDRERAEAVCREALAEVGWRGEVRMSAREDRVRVVARCPRPRELKRDLARFGRYLEEKLDPVSYARLRVELEISNLRMEEIRRRVEPPGTEGAQKDR